MLFQTAEALRRSDAGEVSDAYALVRILTPLIKFRACRDARKVCGDAMEVRGGCGYIEEWSDARLLRDAHLGSIWEGTSNIVALDVIRAIRRDAALPALQAHLQRLLAESRLAPRVREIFARQLQLSLDLARQVAEAQGALDHGARQAASALYHATTAIAMAWEATRIDSPRRLRLAQLVLRERSAGLGSGGGLAAEPAWMSSLLEPAAEADLAALDTIDLFQDEQ